MVVVGESLERRGFAERDGAILLRMKEPSFGGIETPGRDCGCDVIPCHAPVNVAEAVGTSVTGELQTLWKVASPTTVLGNAAYEAGNSWGATFGEVVERVSAIAGCRQVLYCVADCWRRGDRGSEGNGYAKAGDVNEASSALRYSEVRGVHDSIRADVADDLQGAAEGVETSVVSERGHILHHDRGG